MAKKPAGAAHPLADETDRARLYVANWHIKMQHGTVNPGEEISLTDAHAERLGGAVSLKADAPDA